MKQTGDATSCQWTINTKSSLLPRRSRVWCCWTSLKPVTWPDPRRSVGSTTASKLPSPLLLHACIHVTCIQFTIPQYYSSFIGLMCFVNNPKLIHSNGKRKVVEFNSYSGIHFTWVVTSFHTHAFQLCRYVKAIKEWAEYDHRLAYTWFNKLIFYYLSKKQEL